MKILTCNALNALTLAGALLAAPVFAEDAHHTEQLAQNEQSMPMDQGVGMGQGMGRMDWSRMQDMMSRMHNASSAGERQQIRREHHHAMQAQLGLMSQRMQQSQCPMAKDAAPQQQCLQEMHENMQNMLHMMEQMLQNQDQ
jgi:hypothetical protein